MDQGAVIHLPVLTRPGCVGARTCFGNVQMSSIHLNKDIPRKSPEGDSPTGKITYHPRAPIKQNQVHITLCILLGSWALALAQ